MSDEIDLAAQTSQRLAPEELQERREARTHQYKMRLATALVAIVGVAIVVIVLDGIKVEFISFREKSVDVAWDIIKMSLTGLLGFLLASKDRGGDA